MSHDVCMLCEQPWPDGPLTRSAAQIQRGTEASTSHSKAAIATKDLESLFIAALCVVSSSPGCLSETDKTHTLETLLEYGRGAVDTANEGLEDLWRVAARYLYGERHEAPDTENRTVPRKEGV